MSFSEFGRVWGGRMGFMRRALVNWTLLEGPGNERREDLFLNAPGGADRGSEAQSADTIVAVGTNPRNCVIPAEHIRWNRVAVRQKRVSFQRIRYRQQWGKPRLCVTATRLRMRKKRCAHDPWVSPMATVVSALRACAPKPPTVC